MQNESVAKSNTSGGLRTAMVQRSSFLPVG